MALVFALWLVCSYVFYRRFPNNFRQPNFFGEEGSIFSKNILEHGFYHAIGTTFNGYYIWGIYLLEGIGFTVNKLLYGGQFADLPRSFALVSYGFLGFIAVLPTLLFRNRFRVGALLLMTLLILFVPLGGWDYGVLGALGNTKFAVVFIAFMLLLYRHYLPTGSKKIYLVDVGLVICAYTNVTVYPMLPFALLRYWPELWNRQIFKNLKSLVKTDHSFQSLLVLGVALLPQLITVARFGVPAQPGYLDTPYAPNTTIEIFVARSYLYEILFRFYTSLNNLIVVIVFALIAGLMWFFGRKQRPIYAFGLVSVFLATFLFVIKRTGLSIFYGSYNDPGPAQFFFTQNWIFGVLFSILIVELICKFKNRGLRAFLVLALAIGFVFYLAPYAGSYGKNNFMEKGVGNIYAVGQKVCAQPGNGTVTLTIYPTKDQHYTDIPRQRLCTSEVTAYKPSEFSFDLMPAGNNYLDGLGKSNSFTQTFVSPYANLDGISIFFSTFMKTPHSAYNLNLYSEDCKTTISTTKIRTNKIEDNSFYTIRFPAISNSAKKVYCFNVAAANQPSDPLAIQLSANDVYTEGQTTINNQLSTKDIVFGLHYK